MSSVSVGTTRWHVEEMSDVLKTLATDPQGLTEHEAAKRLVEYGANSLPHQPPPTIWAILIRQFQSPLIYVLMAAAGVAVLAGDFKDSAFIGLVLVINAAIGGYQEWRAERNSRALQKLLHIRAFVLRDGEIREVDAEEVVPGDIVWLESGNRIPADMRLITAHGLEVDESLLTGESLAVTKDAEQIADPATPVADRLNLVYAASIVVRGRAKGVVVGTGVKTELGKLALDVMSASGGKPPLLERMEKFSTTIAYVVLAAVLAISAIGYFFHGHSLHEMFLFGVALAVAAIPEGLPAALTVALAVATTRMARRGVIVRRLAAVEGLGSCTMIASDKTGTLTCNELTVREIRLPDNLAIEVEGEGFAPEGKVYIQGKPIVATDHASLNALVQVAALCNEGDLHHRDGQWVWHGDPTDIALLSLGQKLGVSRHRLLDQYPQVNQIPFEPEHRFAASYHLMNDEMAVFVKGAPERVLSMCAWQDADAQATYLQMADEMAERGYRVLGLADGRQRANLSEDMTPPQPTNLTFRGFVGMIDPLRPGAREAVKMCHAAGITVCMVTGDHPVTALAISRELGLADGPEQVVSGAELAGKSPSEMQAAIERGRVFARVAPRQKLELVEAARAAGHYVAVTGDGVNDAPALRAANIGVAMGKSGTDVAREAAELVISDDNFKTIVHGVEEGRVAYDNVRKVIYLLVSTGAAEILLIGVTFFAGAFLPLPFLPVQLLWLNLVTNGIQGIALAFEPGEPGVLRRKPRRPSEPIFDRLMIERTFVAAITMATVGVGAFWWMVQAGWSPDAARNGLLLLMVLFENIHIGNCRSEYASALTLSPVRSPLLLFGAITAFLLHV
ncbi:MAG: HAD-IC family P-type ATPase, partial [Pirellulaceae bacterium]|nr:HAD-IC family P-type ATPase [Pirellulaceae bacterium]